MNKQSQDFHFFVNNHDMLYRQYPDKVLLIQNKHIIGACDNFNDALSLAQEKHLPFGTFIVQECTEGDSAYTQSFNSNVVFA